MEKDYKAMYYEEHVKCSELKHKVRSLESWVERYKNCEIEFIKGKLLGCTIDIVTINRQRYALVELWTADVYNEPEKYRAFLRTTDVKHPVPDWCRHVDTDFVITRHNLPVLILNPGAGQPVHLRVVDNDVSCEAADADDCSPWQVIHDTLCLETLAYDVERFAPKSDEK